MARQDAASYLLVWYEYVSDLTVTSLNCIVIIALSVSLSAALAIARLAAV
ncbi:hypothetical protein V8C34DRAFT_300841 [Trichoderma compactum]